MQSRLLQREECNSAYESESLEAKESCRRTARSPFNPNRLNQFCSGGIRLEESANGNWVQVCCERKVFIAQTEWYISWLDERLITEWAMIVAKRRGGEVIGIEIGGVENRGNRSFVRMNIVNFQKAFILYYKRRVSAGVVQKSQLAISQPHTALTTLPKPQNKSVCPQEQ